MRIRIRPVKIRVRVPTAPDGAPNDGPVTFNRWHNLSLVLSSLFALSALFAFSVALWRLTFDVRWLASAAILFLLSYLCARPPGRYSADAYFSSRYRLENHLPNPYPK